MPNHVQVVQDELTPLLQNNNNSQPCSLNERNSRFSENTEQNGVKTVKSIDPTPLPLPVLGVILLMATTPFTFHIIFPFVNQMILEVGIVDNPEEVGFYSGIVESTFAFLSLVTADIVGRKPIILLGTFLMGISTASFGMSKSLFAMILTRCIGGAVGGVWVAAKTAVAEYTDSTNQVKAFQYLKVTVRLPFGFWIENPFALPCFFAAATATVSVVFGYFFLDETIRSKRRKSIGIQQEETGMNVDASWGTSLKEILTPQIVALLLNNAMLGTGANRGSNRLTNVGQRFSTYWSNALLSEY
ncbi:hypothetical protein Clacol_003198 [Clathrus columnatus]|uniref:Major facilitator superfamily (MFS) profile domain-containing protein n=1 Tax=Clathrus columnatus TaxID=1419009 RepID=A0AAV5A5Q0_9AGAM|nr:hypothetical protein Clacol_003198 [Clathrus columnatus]